MSHTLAYLFPGQGAQAIGMGKTFYDRFPESRDVYARAKARLGLDIAAVCFEGPQEELTKTETCQLALFVTSLAGLEALRSRAPSLAPVGAAGLSLGELTALAAAGAMSFADGLYLVQTRAEAMAGCAARHPGAMLAVIGLDQGLIHTICHQAGVIAANLNAPGQVVLSGERAGIDEAERLANAQGAKRAIKLDVAGAFHSSLMQPAADVFRQAVAKVNFQAPRMPVISNVTAQPVSGPEEIRELLVKQIVSPVRWEPSMRRLIQDGATAYVEFPPARVLTGLLRQIDKTVKSLPLNDPTDLEKLTDF